ncbi:gamma carbonic anhydrase family protein [Mycobacterium sp.]|uniref:gamma carbonic anhydrase family protein n=1 Tax=Mycobacterium sp. TaxID=1785 RepID=UPI003BAA230F
MPLFVFEDRAPIIDPTAFVAPTATLIGDVTIEAGASVWFNTVLRGDYAPIIVREGANVLDGAVLHASPGVPVDIGPGADVAHMAVVRGVHVGAEALIADHATVLDGVVLGARCVIAAQSLVVAGTHIPEGMLATGAPAEVAGPADTSGAEIGANIDPRYYRDLAQRYKAGLRPISGTPS